MECKFVVGQHVVYKPTKAMFDYLAKNGHLTEIKNCTLPTEGKVYTVREVFVGDSGQVAIKLVEIVNPPQHFKSGFKENGWQTQHFKPLPKLTIDQFTKELENV